jgi:hypothetical protein
MMTWLKLYHGDVVSPVYRAVAAATKTRPADVFAIWMANLEFASQNEDRGSVGGLIVGDVAEAFAIDIKHTRAIVRELRRRGWIVADRIADWQERQENPKRDCSAPRMRQLRANRKNAAISTEGDGSAITAPSPVTRHSDLESKTQDSPLIPPKGKALELVHDSDFTELWGIWLKKEGKKPALTKYLAAPKARSAARRHPGRCLALCGTAQ